MREERWEKGLEGEWAESEGGRDGRRRDGGKVSRTGKGAGRKRMG